MEERRKKSYRRLLYQALLDIRVLSTERNSIFSRKKKYKLWYFSFAFHNLAKFNVDDFDGFDERKFWNDIIDLRARYPEINDYRGLFDIFLDADSEDK